MTHIFTEQCLTPSPSHTPTPLFLPLSMLRPVTKAEVVKRGERGSNYVNFSPRYALGGISNTFA